MSLRFGRATLRSQNWGKRQASPPPPNGPALSCRPPVHQDATTDGRPANPPRTGRPAAGRPGRPSGGGRSAAAPCWAAAELGKDRARHGEQEDDRAIHLVDLVGDPTPL